MQQIVVVVVLEGMETVVVLNDWPKDRVVVKVKRFLQDLLVVALDLALKAWNELENGQVVIVDFSYLQIIPQLDEKR